MPTLWNAPMTQVPLSASAHPRSAMMTGDEAVKRVPMDFPLTSHLL